MSQIDRDRERGRERERCRLRHFTNSTRGCNCCLNTRRLTLRLARVSMADKCLMISVAKPELTYVCMTSIFFLIVDTKAKQIYVIQLTFLSIKPLVNVKSSYLRHLKVSLKFDCLPGFCLSPCLCLSALEPALTTLVCPVIK